MGFLEKTDFSKGKVKLGKLHIIILATIILVVFGMSTQRKGSKEAVDLPIVPTSAPISELTPTPSLTPIPTPIPLPDSKVYGPCLNIPVLMYHHVQSPEEAASKNQKNINVNSDVFASQMAYLVQKGYRTITPDELLAGLQTGSLLGKTVLITFDDGYADFYTYAYPELVKNNFRAIVFLSTGLMGAPDYLGWPQISEMHGGGLVDFEDHTWSHKNMGNASEELATYEIGAAKSQLEERGLGPVTSFAYPYGGEGAAAKEVLKDLGIKTAFTTVPGNYQCAKLPYSFRRTRIGNAPLSAYGL